MGVKRINVQGYLDIERLQDIKFEKVWEPRILGFKEIRIQGNQDLKSLDQGDSDSNLLGLKDIIGFKACPTYPINPIGFHTFTYDKNRVGS